MWVSKPTQGSSTHTEDGRTPAAFPEPGGPDGSRERSCALGRGAPGEGQASTGQAVHRLSSAEAGVPPVVSPGVPGTPKQGPGRAVPAAAARVHAGPQLLWGSVRSLTGQQAEERRHPSALWVGGAQEEPPRRGGTCPRPDSPALHEPWAAPRGARGAPLRPTRGLRFIQGHQVRRQKWAGQQILSFHRELAPQHRNMLGNVQRTYCPKEPRLRLGTARPREGTRLLGLLPGGGMSVGGDGCLGPSLPSG